MKEDIELLRARLEELRAKDKNVDMTRGRPFKAQLEIAMPMLKDAANVDFAYCGGDSRNYGDIMGIPAARKLFGELLQVDEKNIMALDGSSLSIMYRLVAFAMDFGVMGEKPFREQGKVKFLCPSPGYDRHFAICEQFGIEMLTVPMLDDGPDMDMVTRLVEGDPMVKGIWCVPKYSNPSGVVYSDETVKKFAALKPAAKDFRIYWDNAYVIHTLYDDDRLLNIFDEVKKCGNDDLVYEFASTSKMTFAGSGVAVLAASVNNLNDFAKRLQIGLINPNKVNQALHVAFLKDVDNMKEIMKAHAALLRPKFELVLAKLEDNFKDDDRVSWSRPRGGYFVSLNVEGVAKRVVELAAYAGAKFTAAGATYPYRLDPRNANIRIAPSVPTVEEMDFAMDALTVAIKIALLEKYGE